jgi:hypothetical protein
MVAPRPPVRAANIFRDRVSVNVADATSLIYLCLYLPRDSVVADHSASLQTQGMETSKTGH